MTYMFKVIYYLLQMYFKILETSVLKYMNLILIIFCLHQETCLKKTGAELELLINIDILLMIKNIISSYLMYLDTNNLYG